MTDEHGPGAAAAKAAAPPVISCKGVWKVFGGDPGQDLRSALSAAGGDVGKAAAILLDAGSIPMPALNNCRVRALCQQCARLIWPCTRARFS